MGKQKAVFCLFVLFLQITERNTVHFRRILMMENEQSTLFTLSASQGILGHLECSQFTTNKPDYGLLTLINRDSLLGSGCG